MWLPCFFDFDIIGGEIAFISLQWQGLSKILWRPTWCESTSWRERELARTSMDVSFYLHLCGNMTQTRSNFNFADDPRKITEVNQQTQIWSLGYKSWNLKDQQIDWPIINLLFISSKYSSASKNHVIVRDVCTTVCPCPFIVSTAVFHRTAKVYTFRYMPSGDAPPKALIRRCIDFRIYDDTWMCKYRL